MVSAILMRALKKDIARYNRLESFNLDDLSGTNGDAENDVQEDSGWKLVHGDVFRTPKNPLLLSIFLGNGSQLFVMVGTTITFALFGFLSPSNRGSLGSAMILLYTIFGFIGGYVSARVYKTFGGEAWKRNIALTPVLIPGIVFATFFLLNLFLWIKQSSGAVPFTTMLVILGIWFVISVPLSFAGSWIGFRHAVSFLFYPITLPTAGGLTDVPSAHSTACPRKPNTAPDPSQHYVLAAPTVHGARWHPTIRRHLCRTLLYHEQYVVRQSLLHVRVSLPLLWHYDHHLCCRHHPPRILLALRRELSLAVAEFLHGRGLGRIRVC